MHIELDPALLEEVVFLAMRRQEQLGDRVLFQEYRNRVDALYAMPVDDDRREIAFRDVHAEFFSRLGFERMLRDRLDELPLLGRELDRVSFMKVAARKQEDADLFVRAENEDTSTPHRTAVVRLRAELFLNPEELLTFLRHELYHISDMVDPAFGYRRDLGDVGESRARENLIRDRYRAMWTVFIDARLVRAGRTAATVLQKRQSLLEKVFQGLDDHNVQRIIRTVTTAESLSHADLLALANAEPAQTAEESAQTRTASRQFV